MAWAFIYVFFVVKNRRYFVLCVYKFNGIIELICFTL